MMNAIVKLLLTTLTGSRRLITYRRLPDSQVSQAAIDAYDNREKLTPSGTTADELNPFRRGYFKKFGTDQ